MALVSDWFEVLNSKSFRCVILDGFGLRLFCSKSFRGVSLECLVGVFEKAGSSLALDGL